MHRKFEIRKGQKYSEEGSEVDVCYEEIHRVIIDVFNNNGVGL